MPLTFSALKTELQTDPRAYGYASLLAASNWNAVRDLLNLPRTGANGGPAITIRRDDVSSSEIFERIDMADMPALSGTPNANLLSIERQRLAWLTGLAAIPLIRITNDDGTNTGAATTILAIFPAGSGTRTRLVALGNRFGSRAEELFGRNLAVSDGDVETAWKLP